MQNDLEIRANAMIAQLEGQRNRIAADSATQAGEIAVLQAQVADLKKQVEALTPKHEEKPGGETSDVVQLHPDEVAA